MYLLQAGVGVALVLAALQWSASARAASEEQQVAEGAEAAESATSEPVEEADIGLDTVSQIVRTDLEESRERMKEREARFDQVLEKAKQRLANAEARMAELERIGTRLEGTFESNSVELDEKVKLLKDKLGALKELFGVFQQNASDLIGAFNNSPTSIQYIDRDDWLEGFANRMKNASEVSSVDDIQGLWYEMQREITALGDIVKLNTPVVNVEGESSDRDLVRIGGFSLISNAPQTEYLYWSDAGQEVVALSRQPEAAYLSQVDSYLSAAEGLHSVAVDPTGGVLTALLIQKPTLVERIHQGALVGYIILALGAVALLLAAYKLFDIATISLRVNAQQRAPKSPNPDNVLGQLLLTYQKNLHVDSEILEMRLHESVQKGALRVNRFAIFLSIIAAVAPLLGLLGTVVGMINTFQAITLYGTGDPQTMAGGISQALITTVLGLTVAVPAVLLHAIVHGRAKSVINVLHTQMAALTGDQIQQERANEISNQAGKTGGGPLPEPAPA